MGMQKMYILETDQPVKQEKETKKKLINQMDSWVPHLLLIKHWRRKCSWDTVIHLGSVCKRKIHPTEDSYQDLLHSFIYWVMDVIIHGNSTLSMYTLPKDEFHLKKTLKQRGTFERKELI